MVRVGDASYADILNRNAAVFERYNQRRIESFRDYLPERKRLVFDLLPFLLHESDGRLPGNETSAPAGVFGFSITTALRALIKETFPFFEFDARARERFSISFVALMGSAGSIGFTDESDFDIWVGIEEGRLSETAAALLAAKLTAIEAWAAQTAGLEIHFFAAEHASIRANAFGQISQESCGSALGKLLKDEFCRTALFLEGKKPLYWIVPADTPDGRYAQYHTAMQFADKSIVRNYVDLGNISAISRGEYFGAALWHLLKGVRSPFKSVLKLALLDAYATEAGAILPLCETYKAKVLRADAAAPPDPYIFMAEELRSFYARQNFISIRQLLEECFLVRNLGIAAPEAAANKARREFFMYTGAKWGWTGGDMERFARFSRWDSFERDNLHARIIGFLLKTYQRIRAQAGVVAASISQRDLTIVSRKLACYFVPKEGKVPYEFALFRTADIAAIEMMERLDAKRSKGWLVKLRMRGVQRAEYSTVRELPDPAVACAWCALNRFYDGTQAVRIQGTSFLSVKEATNLIAALDAFFRAHLTDSLDFGGLLAEQRITHLYAVPVGDPFSRQAKNAALYAFMRTTAGELLYEAYRGDSAAAWLTDELMRARIGPANLARLTWAVYAAKEALSSPRTVSAQLTKKIQQCIAGASKRA